jgi:hypothetical protein
MDVIFGRYIGKIPLPGAFNKCGIYFRDFCFYLTEIEHVIAVYSFIIKL